MFRERKTGVSKGCGFITFQTREQAVKAMEALENKSAEVRTLRKPPARKDQSKVSETLQRFPVFTCLSVLPCSHPRI